MTRVPFLAAGLLLFGCGAAEEGEDPMPTGPVSVEIGTGESRFEPLSDGQVVPLIAGSQGGFHVWVSIRARGFDASRLRMSLTTSVMASAAGEAVRTSDLELGFDRRSDGALEYVGWPGVLDVDHCPIGTEVRVSVTLSDDSGATASDEKSVEPDASEAFRLPPSCPSAS